MIDGTGNNLLGKVGGGITTGGVAGGAKPAGASFADVLKGSIEEVVKLQQDASTAVNALATGQTDDMVGVMSAMEKSDMAFKTLLSIRSKLMEAYEEIKNTPV